MSTITTIRDDGRFDMPSCRNSICEMSQDDTTARNDEKRQRHGEALPMMSALAYLPEFGTNLVTTLSSLDMNDFTHGCLII